MADEPNIAELAVAAWRLERWLDNLVAERKMAAKSSLRSIKKYLEASNIEIVDPLGCSFDPGLPIEVVNNEAPDVDESELIIIETNSPIIKRDGAPIQFGRVILGQKIKKQKSNSEIKQAVAESATIDSQEDLFVTQDDLMWIKKLVCKEERTGSYPVVVVETEVELEALMLDEEVFADFVKGFSIRNPFEYTLKVGKSVIQIPYNDIWYINIYPPEGHYCREYRINVYCDWQDSRVVNPDIIRQKSEIAMAQENIHTVIDSADGIQADGAEEELIKLRSDNMASYHKEIAKDKGHSIERHKKSPTKSKKKKHKKKR